MQVLDYYPAAPGQCFFCGNARGRKVLDTERDIEFYGRVYICEQDAAAIARLFMIAPPVAEKINLEDLSEHVFRVSHSIDSLGDVVASLSRLVTVDKQQELQYESVDKVTGDSVIGTSDGESAPVITSIDGNAGNEGSDGVPEHNSDGPFDDESGIPSF